MAKPRIFVSSTYYDLKHLRSSLENFIDKLGYEPILSEKGDIAYSPDVPLDESCYREASNADIFVLIIGGRYGSETSKQKQKGEKAFFDRYDSITKQEYKNAVSKKVPTYILIEKGVYAEYQTYLKNKKNTQITYAHVDSVNIFNLIEEILAQPKNNPIFTFERYSEIEHWLCEQWAGLFKELLKRMSESQQIASLSAKVAELGEINITLQRYLEAIMQKVTPQESKTIIQEESKRLREVNLINSFRNNLLIGYILTHLKVSLENCIDAIEKAKSFEEFLDTLKSVDILKSIGDVNIDDINRSVDSLIKSSRARDEYNKAREILGLAPLKIKNEAAEKE